MHDGTQRALALVVLALVFGGLIIHYGGAAPQHELTRESSVKLQSPDAHAGETVHFWAEVQRNDDALVVLVGDGTDLTVVGAETTAQPGDSIQIYGTIQPEGNVAAQRTVVSERSGLRRLYAVSIGALALTVLVFFRSWTVDIRRLAFVPREGETDA
jgi:hypothetical protein